jgi:hypothetical protein
MILHSVMPTLALTLLVTTTPNNNHPPIIDRRRVRQQRDLRPAQPLERCAAQAAAGLPGHVRLMDEQVL